MTSVRRFAEKDLIYSHPLFPLLIIAFEKCELATNSSNPLGSFDEDIVEFTKQLTQEQLQCYTSNSEIDDLMIQTIQMLRFHLLEIEKVHELCQNFCQTYIHLLKEKIPVNILLDDSKSDAEEEEEEESIDHLTPLSVGREYPSPSLSQSLTDENFESDLYEENDDLPQHRPKKRGMFPKSATSIMRAWLFQHLHHPYPSDEEKKSIAQETNLNISQVNNWFINARRRIVQPMIDQSNQTGMDYNDLMVIHPYHTFDSSGISYGFPTNLYEDMRATPGSCPSVLTTDSYLWTRK